MVYPSIKRLSGQTRNAGTRVTSGLRLRASRSLPASRVALASRGSERFRVRVQGRFGEFLIRVIMTSHEGVFIQGIQRLLTGFRAV